MVLFNTLYFTYDYLWYFYTTWIHVIIFFRLYTFTTTGFFRYLAPRTLSNNFIFDINDEI